MSDEDKGFAARWSRRKATARGENQPDADREDQKVLDDPNSSTPDTEIKELLSEEDFDDVDFDALDKSSDYTRFIQANVPAAIQQKALRKLWSSDSVFEVLDGMNDYDEDFTGNGLAGKALKTAYKVGRGFIEDQDQDAKSSGSDQAAGDEIIRENGPPENRDGENGDGENEAQEEISTAPADNVEKV